MGSYILVRPSGGGGGGGAGPGRTSRHTLVAGGRAFFEKGLLTITELDDTIEGGERSHPISSQFVRVSVSVLEDVSRMIPGFRMPVHYYGTSHADGGGPPRKKKPAAVVVRC